MDVKIKTELDFKDYYYKDYINKISEYYDILKNKLKKTIISRITIGSILYVVLLVGLISLKKYLDSIFYPTIFIFFVVILFACLISVYKYLKSYFRSLNDLIAKDLLAFISENNIDNIIHEPQEKISLEYFSKLDLFNLNTVNYTGKNYSKIPYNKSTMIFSDIHTFVYDVIETTKEIFKDGKKYLQTIRKKQIRTIFKGLYIGATLNKHNTEHIYLIPNNLKDTVLQSKIMNYIKFHGVPVSLENLEFSKKYKVFCDDEVQARYILSLGLMEKINNLDGFLKGKKYIVFKEGKRFALCIEGICMDDFKNRRLPLFRNENKELDVLMNMFNNFNNLFKVYFVLGLNTDLYV